MLLHEKLHILFHTPNIRNQGGQVKEDEMVWHAWER
jgi:hypothetical protein